MIGNCVKCGSTCLGMKPVCSSCLGEINPKPKLRVEPVYYEYDCGHPCTVDGCPGHDGPVVGLTINGQMFVNEDFTRGDTIVDIEDVEAAALLALAALGA